MFFVQYLKKKDWTIRVPELPEKFRVFDRRSVGTVSPSLLVLIESHFLNFEFRQVSYKTNHFLPIREVEL